MFSVAQTRTFSAAHYLAGAEARPHYRHMHGHSFTVTVRCTGGLDAGEGWVVDLETLDGALAETLSLLEDRVLNDVEGLGAPTMENISRFIFDRLAAKSLPVCEVQLSRPSLGQSVTYTKG